MSLKHFNLINKFKFQFLNRLKEFDEALNAEEIRLSNFRKLCFEGKTLKKVNKTKSCYVII